MPAVTLKLSEKFFSAKKNMLIFIGIISSCFIAFIIFSETMPFYLSLSSKFIIFGFSLSILLLIFTIQPSIIFKKLRKLSCYISDEAIIKDNGKSKQSIKFSETQEVLLHKIKDKIYYIHIKNHHKNYQIVRLKNMAIMAKTLEKKSTMRFSLKMT